MSYIEKCKSHIANVLLCNQRGCGAKQQKMWMASIDIKAKKPPLDFSHPEAIGKRCYRNIEAPGGSSLYWDQPLLVAALKLSDMGVMEPCREAVNRYISCFLEQCVAKNGIFLWGNHYYYDYLQDAVVSFSGEEAPKPVDFSVEDGRLHEIRPIMPAWELFYEIDPQKTERCIRMIGKNSVFDQEIGGFNRHAYPYPQCAFLESGGTLAESLCWLYTKTKDDSLVEDALRIASYSFQNRNLNTGLLENNPTETRWDKHTATTEVGLWALCLLKCAEYTGAEAFLSMADQAVSAYLKYGYDEKSGFYYGKLRISDGVPITGEKETPYQPGVYADLWEPLFPIHNYPMSVAESAVKLFSITQKEIYHECIERFQKMIRLSLPARNGAGAYAEHYARCIHFLTEAAKYGFGREYQELAHQIADEAIQQLFFNDMFRGHPGEDRCDAVDGVGFLILALMGFDEKEDSNLYGTHF